MNFLSDSCVKQRIIKTMMNQCINYYESSRSVSIKKNITLIYVQKAFGLKCWYVNFVISITEPSNIDLDPMETEPAIPEKLQK